ncbi:FtsK/SpoIIIE family protein,FHA domain-containing protein [Frankia torreyi]|uniref:FtsK/SpoIIIE family protein,FHA domain-containing protein n=2 Tax=Frankia TaxID=1854 RepID=A0A0D8BFI9_9ACTN|nr:FtsK/SpoIIIE domain-containing protein [Frankia torreyi]KJE23053.1 FtsK/SpoIIIE family protein,FHA domain-containing protein [Frankia torreyi]
MDLDLDLELVDRGGDRQVVSVAIGPDTRVGDVRSALRTFRGATHEVPARRVDVRRVGAGEALYAGTAPLDDTLTLTDAGLLPGSVVALGRPVPASPPNRQEQSTEQGQPTGQGQWQLAVVGGLHAGSTAALPLSGEVRVGRDPGNDIVLSDPEVSRDHAILTIDSDRVELSDAGSRNGVSWHGYRLDDRVALRAGDVFQLGETVLELRRSARVSDVLTADPLGPGYVVNRPPRIPDLRPEPTFGVPAAPVEPRAFRFPLVSVAMPLLVAGALFALLPGARYYLVFMVLSPVMLVANVWSDRRSGRADHHRQVRDHADRLAALRAELATLAQAEELRLRAQLPDPATLLTTVVAPTGRLWERRVDSDDFLRLRCGLATSALDVRIADPDGAVDVPMCRLVPVTIDLPTAGVVGLAGCRPAVLAAARALVVQVTVLHDPDAVGLVLLTGEPDTATDWEWTTWLPHLRPSSTAAEAPWRSVGVDADQAEARLAELRRLIEERRVGQAAGPPDPRPAGRRYVLLLDGARRLRALRGLTEVLRDGPAVGVYAVCLDVNEASLPDECRATVTADGPAGSRLRIRRPTTATVDGVVADGMPRELAEHVARALRPLRLLGGMGPGAELPESLRYVELAGLTESSPAATLARWAAGARPGQEAGGGAGGGEQSTEMLLGVGVDGPLTADLRRDGPHALVAGTSGSGKSELLQTMVASLALGNSPEALTFLLVDYKGGSAFATAAALPHCVGLVTDLDGHHAGRVLESLSAELRRRERLLAAAGAKDVDELWVSGAGRLPRLVIVVDEFATLVEEVPDFVPGLVGIGMRGRSLGVHLILATQRPAGVVTPELRANVNLRICLRVTSQADSTDVVDVPDAAHLSSRTPGRAYLRTGHRELTAFQTARVGWPRPAAALAAGPARVVPRRLADAGGAPSQPQRADQTGRTDLDVIIDDVRAAARQTGAAEPRRPWLPPLPELLTRTDLAAVPRGDSPVAVALGLADRPADQVQDLFVVDLERTGALAVAGTVRSGRSTVLRTLAAGLAETGSPADVHLYAIDCGNGAMRGLAALPHTGAVVDGTDLARLDRLFAFLDREITRRQRQLAAAGQGSLAEQRACAPPADQLPYLVVLLDQLEGFHARYADTDGGRLVDAVERLLRHGPSAGVFVVLSTDRSGFSYRISGMVESRLVLRQADHEDFAVYGLDRRRVPRGMPAGRAVWAATGEQVQVVCSDAAAVVDLAAEARRRWESTPEHRRPRRLDPLPERIRLRDVATPLVARAAYATPAAGHAVCTPVVGGDHLAPIDVDLSALGGSFVVAGPVGSGRSSALVSIIETLRGRVDGELPVVLAAPRQSPLRGLAALPGVVEVCHRADDLARHVDECATSGRPVAVVVDDAELVGDAGAAALLERFLRTARDSGSILVAAGTTEDLIASRYRGWVAGALRSRSGLLLCPTSPVDGEVFDLRLPRSGFGRWPPGRALLVARGNPELVQVLDPVREPAVDWPEDRAGTPGSAKAVAGQ